MKTVASQLPALKLLIIIVFVILSLSFIQIYEDILLGTIVVFFILSILLFALKKYSTSFYSIGFTIGIILYFYELNTFVNSPNKIIEPEKAVVKAEIIRIMKIHTLYERYLVNGEIDSKHLPKLKDKKLLLTIFKHSNEELNFKNGDVIGGNVKILLPKKAIYPGEFRENIYASNLGASFVATCNTKDIGLIGHKKSISYYRALVLEKIHDKINTHFSTTNAAIIKAMLTGDKSELEYTTKELFSLSGTAHLLAVSGLHVGIIAFLIYTLLGIVKIRLIKFLIFSLVILGFIFITGFQPSAIRAGLMAITFVFVKTIQRQIYPINIVAFVILFILISKPELFYSISFQMSAGAMLGITFCYSIFERNLVNIFKTKNGLSNYTIKSFALTISASLITTPLVAYYFEVNSIISPLANLFVVPLMSGALIFGVITVIISFISTEFALIYSSSSEFFINLSIFVNSYAINLPNAYITGEKAFVIAIASSILGYYILLSNAKKLLFFRIIISIVAFILFINIYDFKENKNINIYPTEQFTAIELTADDHILFLIFDRKPSIYPKKDYTTLNYLSNMQDSLRIGISGNAGINICDNLSQVKTFDTFYISIEEQKAIKEMLKLEKYPCEIIEKK